MRTRKSKKFYPTSIFIILILMMSVGWARKQLLVPLSQDPYTDAAGGQHSTEVEPMMATHGTTIVTAFQVARFQGTGSENIGWATSFDAGLTWQRGFLQGTTTIAGGKWFSASLPVVVYNQKYNEWLISMMGYDDQGNSYGVYVVRSTDGIHWSKPITVATVSDSDKEWIACDNSAKSPYYGNCYEVWIDYDDFIDRFSASRDGGLTWSAPIISPDQASGEIGSMSVQPNGHVIMVGTYGGLNFDQEYSIQSVDGGKSLNASVNVTTYQFTFPGQGYLRADPFPTSAVDSNGVFYMIYADCRFRDNCATDDLVMSSTTDGINWSPITRIPIDAVNSGADHFLPGLAINHGLDIENLGHSNSAKLGLSYYYFPNGNCDINSCQLHAAFISSDNGGKTWSAPIDAGVSMSLNWVAFTQSGQMVGNQASTAFILGVPFSALAVATPPNPKTGKFNEAVFATVYPQF